MTAVQGDANSGQTDTGTGPVKVGGVFRTTQPTLTDGQRGEAQVDARGNLRVTPVGSNGISVASVGTPSDSTPNSTNGQFVVSDTMIYNGTTWERLRSSIGGDGVAGTGLLGLYLWDGVSTYNRIRQVQGDSAVITGMVATVPSLINSPANGATNTDRMRGNCDGTTGDTGAKTTGTFNGATQTNYNARGAVITCLLGTVTGAVTTFQTGIQWSYDGGTTWLGLTPLGANDTAAVSGRTYSWIIYPTNTSQAAGVTPANLAPNAGPTQLNAINAALPRTWRFQAVVSVATSIVITNVYVNYIL